MEPFRTAIVDIRGDDGVKINTKPPAEGKSYDFIKIGDYKIERKINEPTTLRISTGENDIECLESENKALICKKVEKRGLFESF